MYKKILLLALALSVTACANMQQLMKENIKEPEVAYKNISIGQLSSEKIELKPTFSIANKNGYSIPIDRLKYELSFNQKTMIQGETDKVGNLPANKSKDVTLGIGLTKDTLLAVKDVLLKQGKIDYVIKGEVEVMGLTFPFEKASTIYKPTVSLGKLEIKSASFKQVEMVVNLRVNNNNDFTLPLDMLSYTVSAGADQLAVGNLKDQKIKQGVNQIKIPLTVNLSTLFSSVFSLMQNPQLPLRFNFNAGGFEKSVEQTLDLKSLFGG
jgi:LEA14-like dessication related protein